MVHTNLSLSQAKIDQPKNRKKNDYRPIDSNSGIIDYTLIANFYLFFGWLEQREVGSDKDRNPAVLSLFTNALPHDLHGR